jgi:hypothetical protein
MSVNELKYLLDAVPFRPFTVHMPSDTSYRVPHPDFALLNPNDRTMLVVGDQSDAVEILEVPLITRVDVEAERGAGT